MAKLSVGMKVLQSFKFPEKWSKLKDLHLPQARVLRALMPPGDGTTAPALTRVELAQRVGFSPKSGTINRALHGIHKGSPSGSPYQGLLDRGLVDEVELDGIKAYQITPDGRKAIEKLDELPKLKDKASCTNDRYLLGGTQEVIEALEKSHAKSQGFLLDSKLRKALEDHAMAEAKRYFKSKGYEVEDHHKEHPYDLRCTNKNETLHVEVKGTQTDGDSIFLTFGEVEFARHHKGQMALFLVCSIKVSEAGKILNKGARTAILPWDVDAGCLKPISFRYEVPGKPGP